MSVCVFSSIWDGDSHWVDQYLAELERLNLPFMMHFDRCTQELKDRVLSHRLCSGHTSKGLNPKAFDERDKQGVFDLVGRAGFQWALAMDVDETWEKEFPTKLQLQLAEVPSDYSRIVCHWMNLWDSPEFIRVDGEFAPRCSMGTRKKFYRVNVGLSWRFVSPIVNGPKSENMKGVAIDLTCLHWGFMKKEWRQAHKKVWDHNYSTTHGSNPYGSWNHSLDETITPVLEKHSYF